MKTLFLSLFLACLTSCSGEESSQTVMQKETTPPQAIEKTVTQAVTESSNTTPSSIQENNGSLSLEKRSGTPPETTEGIPHIQLTQVSDSDVYDRFVDSIYQIEGIVNNASQSSLPGARAFALEENLQLNTNAVITGREFGHIHANPGAGSLHLVLSVQDSETVINTGWGIPHPFALNGSIPGMIMVFAPRSDQESEVILEIIKASLDNATL